LKKTIMSPRNTTVFDPFERHRQPEDRPKPNQARPTAGTSAVQPVEPAACTNSAGTEKPSVSLKPVDATPTGESPFARHETEPKDRREPERAQKPPAQELLIWIQQCWNKPVIALRDIQTYAPPRLQRSAVSDQIHRNTRTARMARPPPGTSARSTDMANAASRGNRAA
jgi:hypothetical protein